MEVIICTLFQTDFKHARVWILDYSKATLKPIVACLSTFLIFQTIDCPEAEHMYIASSGKEVVSSILLNYLDNWLCKI